MFSITPERLDAIDMLRAARKLFAAVNNSEVLGIANINESVIATPAVTMDNGFRRDPTANNGLQSCLFAVRDDLRIDLAITLQDTKNNRLATRSATALTTHTTSTKVRLANFYFTDRERRRTFAIFGNAAAELEKDQGHALARQTRELSRVGGSEIERKVTQQLAKFLGGNSGTAVERIWSFHVSSLALP